jgi:hypothetical protein
VAHRALHRRRTVAQAQRVSAPVRGDERHLVAGRTFVLHRDRDVVGVAEREVADAELVQPGCEPDRLEQAAVAAVE